jgi:hypothetical protein
VFGAAIHVEAVGQALAHRPDVAPRAGGRLKYGYLVAPRHQFVAAAQRALLGHDMDHGIIAVVLKKTLENLYVEGDVDLWIAISVSIPFASGPPFRRWWGWSKRLISG